MWNDAIWSHDEQKYVTRMEVNLSKVVCMNCGAVHNKYCESHYTGGAVCAILTKYCRKCGASLEV